MAQGKWRLESLDLMDTSAGYLPVEGEFDDEAAARSAADKRMKLALAGRNPIKINLIRPDGTKIAFN